MVLSQNVTRGKSLTHKQSVTHVDGMVLSAQLHGWSSHPPNPNPNPHGGAALQEMGPLWWGRN